MVTLNLMIHTLYSYEGKKATFKT